MNDFLPSIFDRLIDPTLATNRWRYSLSQVEAVVLRDLNDLLNTRRPLRDYFAGLDEVERSIANFGLMDFTHLNANSAEARAEFAEHLRDIIELYEPRLTKVEVIARSPEDVQSEDPTLFKFGAVYLRIRATLKLDPFPIDGILFDTMLDLNSGVHKISQPGVLR